MAAGSIIIDLLMNTGSFETDTQRASNAMKRMNKDIQDTGKSAEQLGYKFDSMFNTWRKVEGAQNAVSQSLQKSQAGFRATNQVVQQASYQITDFVVQVTGGVSAFRAFSQQAPQFLAAFGGTGALIGVFAAIGGAIADLVSKSLDIKTTADIFKDLEDSASAVTSAISMTGKVDLSGLGKNYREATKDGKALIDANITMSMLMLDMAKIDATATFREGIKQSLADIGFFSRAWNLVVNSAKYARADESPTNAGQFADIMGITEKQAQAIDSAQMALAQGKMTGAAYVNVLNEVFGSYDKLTNKQKEFYKAQVKEATQLQQQTDLYNSVKSAQENNYKGLEKLTDGQKSFIQALKERTEKVESGEIAMLRMQAAEKGVSAAAEPLLQKLSSMKWGEGADKFTESLITQTEALSFQASLVGKSAKDVELLNAQYKIYADLQKQIQDLTRQNGTVSTEAIAEMTAAAEAQLAVQQQIIAARQAEQETIEFGVNKALQSYAENAGNAAKQAESAITGTLNSMTQGFSNAIESMIFDGASLEQAIHSLAENMLRAIVNALTQMAAQWVAYQLVQMAIAKTTETAAATAASLEAQSMVAMAGLNAFAATAAIPIVGPGLAPAAAAAAVAATEPMAATVAALSMAAAGARADGGPVTSGKPYLVGERGPELFMPNTHGSIVPNARLGGGSGGNITVNMIEDKRRAGQTQEKTNNDGKREIDVFVADILGDGPRAKAVQKAFGLSRRGY